MDKIVRNIEGLELIIEKPNADDEKSKRKMAAYTFRLIREKSGMNRKEFCEWLGVPYRTMQEWELGRRVMPDYVQRLIAYKVFNELEKGRIGVANSFTGKWKGNC